MQWLEEIEAESLEYLRGAYARDKKEGVGFFKLFSWVMKCSLKFSSFENFHFTVTQYWMQIVTIL